LTTHRCVFETTNVFDPRVVLEIASKYSAQMAFTKDNDMVSAFATALSLLESQRKQSVMISSIHTSYTTKIVSSIVARSTIKCEGQVKMLFIVVQDVTAYYLKG